MRLMLLPGTALLAVTFLGLDAQTVTVSERPVLSIGQIDGDPRYLLSQISHVRRQRNGRILVTMGPNIRFFDSQGLYLGDAGGPGRGPGEFQHIQDIIVLPGDTLLVLHFRDRVWLSPYGRYLRQEWIDLTAVSTDGWASEGSVLLPNGNLLVPQYRRDTRGESRRTGLFRPTLRYAVFDIGNTIVRPLYTAGGLRQMFTERGPAIQPFSPHARHAIGPERIYVGDNDTTYVKVFSLDGEELGTIHVASRAVSVTASHLEGSRSRTLDRIGRDVRQREYFEHSWDVVPQPSRFPYWDSMVADALGFLWVSSPNIPGTPKVWTIFDSGGRPVSSVQLPEAFRPIEIGRDYMLGVARDEFDVEYVHMYRVTRSGT